MKNNDEMPGQAPDPAEEPPVKLRDDGSAAARRGFLHRLASFGLGEGPDQLLVPRTRLSPADVPDTGD